MAVIIYTDRPGIRSYLRGNDQWSENQADAILFADATAANNYLAANPVSQPTSQLAVTGVVHFSKKTANH